MGEIRDLVRVLPGMVMTRDADRFSHRNLMVFDYEVARPESVYSHREGDKGEWRNRLKALEIPADLIAEGKEETYRFGMDLLAFVALCHRERKLKELGEMPTTKESGQMEFLETDLNGRALLPENQEVTAVLTVEAAVRVWWSQ